MSLVQCYRHLRTNVGNSIRLMCKRVVDLGMTNQLYTFSLLAADGTAYARRSPMDKEEADRARAHFVANGGKASEVRPA